MLDGRHKYSSQEGSAPIPFFEGRVREWSGGSANKYHIIQYIPDHPAYCVLWQFPLR